MAFFDTDPTSPEALSTPYRAGPPPMMDIGGAPQGGMLPQPVQDPNQAALQGAVAQQQGGTPNLPTTPAPPTMPQGMGANDPLMQIYQDSLGRGRQAIEHLRTLGQQQSQVPTATAWHPQYQHGQGAGGFFHNLGQALMTIGLATHHGQALQGAMARGPQEQRAQEIEGIQAQVKPEQEATEFEKSAMAGAGGLAYKQGMLGVREQGQETAAKRAETYARDVASKSADRLVKETQGYERLSIAQQKQKLQDWYDHERLTVEREGQALGLTKAEIAAQTGRSIAAALQGNSYIKEHPFLYGVAQAIPGLKEYLPDLQAPEGAVTDTTKPGQPIPQSKAGGPSKPRASGAAPPTRPKGVPSNAQWNPATRRWTLPSPGGVGM